MSAPPPSQKDGQQVLKYAFDDATGSLRTNATLVADSVTLNIDAADDSIAIGDQSNGHLMKVNSDGSINVVIPTPVPITATSLPLPTGASTEAKQDVGNTSLASIDSKLTSPLIVTGPLTDTELRASAVPISGSVSVSGTVSATQGTSPWVVSGTVTSNGGTAMPWALQLDNTSTMNVTYVGIAAVGSATSAAAWQIKKIDQTSGLVITWAGSAAYNQIWNNRTSLTYT